MFYIFYKDRIISYVVSFSTVMLLLGIAYFVKKNPNTINTSGNQVNNTCIINEIQNKNK